MPLVSLYGFKTGYKLKFTLILCGAVPGSKEISAISWPFKAEFKDGWRCIVTCTVVRQAQRLYLIFLSPAHYFLKCCCIAETSSYPSNTTLVGCP